MPSLFFSFLSLSLIQSCLPILPQLALTSSSLEILPSQAPGRPRLQACSSAIPALLDLTINLECHSVAVHHHSCPWLYIFCYKIDCVSCLFPRSVCLLKTGLRRSPVWPWTFAGLAWITGVPQPAQQLFPLKTLLALVLFCRAVWGTGNFIVMVSSARFLGCGVGAPHPDKLPAFSSLTLLLSAITILSPFCSFK